MIDVKDRVIQYPSRYELTEVSTGVYDLTQVTGTVTEEGTPINKLLFDDIYNSVEKLMINDMLMQLKFTANSSNIDAWCDVLTDTSLFKTSSSNTRNVKIDAGKLKFANQLLQKDTWASGTVGASYAVGNSSYQKQRIPVSLTYACEISSIEIAVKLAGSPTDNVKVELTDSAMTTIYSSFTIPYSSFNSSSYTKIVTAITPVILDASTQYYIVVSRSGSLDGSNYYFLCGATGTSYGCTTGQSYNGTTWASTQPFYLITIVDPTGYVEWNSVTSSEILEKMAIVSNETVGTGTIDWYLSDDGTNWLEITSFNEMFTTSFDATTIHMKCVITGDSYVEAVAYGGI